ncbi:hypothetical protein, partial [Siminovitchia fortis]|uniref:hypothetical protein n=1 Tax=Siminovitchia fortis TaxID=254758 RepID=UPI000EF0272A
SALLFCTTQQSASDTLFDFVDALELQPFFHKYLFEFYIVIKNQLKFVYSAHFQDKLHVKYGKQ